MCTRTRNPCKMGTGISAGSRQESRFLPGSCWELKNLPGKRNFPARILTGSWQQKLLARILARIPARVSVPGVILPRHRWSHQDNCKSWQDNYNLGKMRRLITDHDETSEKILQVVVYRVRVNVSEVYCNWYFYQSSFQTAILHCSLCWWIKKYGDHRAGVRAGTLCEIVKTMVNNSEHY